MKMRTFRKLRTLAPRRARARRNEFDLTDAAIETEPAPRPEAVFDRLTGPFGSPDEET